MAKYAGMSMPQLYAIAANEANNAGVVQTGAQFWGNAPKVLQAGHGGLSAAAAKVAESWRDSTYDVAFKAPVDEGLASIKNSEQIIVGSNAQQLQQTLATQIEFTFTKVSELYERWLALQAELEQLNQMAQANPLAAGEAMARAAAIMAEMEELRKEAARHVTDLANAYNAAAGAAQAAGSGHAWNGPTAGGPPAVAADSGAAAAAVGMPAGGAGAGASGAAGLPADGAAVPGGKSPGAGAEGLPVEQPPLDEDLVPGGGGTGLAGVGTVPPPAAVTPPPSVPPAGVPTTPTPPFGGGAVPIAPIGAAGGVLARTAPIPPVGTGGGKPSIPRAAEVSGGISSASSGKAPVLPTMSTGSNTAMGGGRAVLPIAPLGAGAAAAGVPATLGRSENGGLQGLIHRLKPVVTPPGGPDGDDNRQVGVPRSLRGRSSRTEDPMAWTSNRNRRSQDEDAPTTVQLLDEEIWQVTQAEAATKTVQVRQGADQSTG